jgi:hypothetical protein
MATGSRCDAERRFWDRYRDLLIKQGVKPTAVRWHVQRAEQFILSVSGRRLANLYRQDVDWAFWRDSARALQEQHATTAREHAPVRPEECTQSIGESRFAPLMRNHLGSVARFSTVICTRDMSIRTEKSHIGWCCRFLPRFEVSRPESLGAPGVRPFLAVHPLGDGVHHFFRRTVHRYGFPAWFSGASIQSRCPRPRGEYN